MKPPTLSVYIKLVIEVLWSVRKLNTRNMKGLIVLLAAAACLSFLQFSASTNCREGCYPVEPDVESAFSNTSLQLLVLEGQCYASCLNRVSYNVVSSFNIIQSTIIRHNTF